MKHKRSLLALCIVLLVGALLCGCARAHSIENDDYVVLKASDQSDGFPGLELEKTAPMKNSEYYSVDTRRITLILTTVK